MKLRQLLVRSGSLCLLVFLAMLPANSGHFVGNGGGYVRDTFMMMGNSVMDFLANTEEGSALVQEHKLDLSILGQTLDIQKITVVDYELIDNTGSVVDAIGMPGSITLSKQPWFEHFEMERDVYYLVFHEMLRSAGVNDDNNVISNHLQSFPGSLRIRTRVVPLIPLISDDSLLGILDEKSLNVGGTGCRRLGDKTRIELDQENNSLSLSFAQYRVEASRDRAFDRKNCQVAIPAILPAGKRLVISQFDMSGTMNIASGSHIKIDSEAFLAGTVEPLKSRLIDSSMATQGRFLIRRTDVLKSRCGGSDILRVNTALQIAGSQVRPEEVSMKSVKLYLSLESCK
jgi:hypothetical protein